MRVFELAKLLDVSSKELLSDLKRMRLQVKNHMSLLEDREVERIKLIYVHRRTREKEEGGEVKPGIEAPAQDSLPTQAPPVPPASPGIPAVKSPRPTLFLKSQPGTTDKAKQDAIEKAKAVHEAREQTLKEKRIHRPPLPQVALLIKKKAMEKATKEEAPPAPASPKAAPPEKRPEPGEEKRLKEQEKEKGKGKKKKNPLKPGEFVIPTIEVMSFKELKKDIAERWRKRSKGKKPPRKPHEANIPIKAGKKIRPSFFLDLETLPVPKRARPPKKKVPGKPKINILTIHGDITVEEFAQKIQVSVPDMLSKLETLGESFVREQILTAEYIELLAEEFEIKAEIIPEDDQYDIRDFLVQDKEERLQTRPPVVTIMGHVDHGKTTLLDSIRKSDIAGREYGGITQHIGAYSVKTQKGDIVFLDTPGHEAFTAMRARGAQVTDIVVLVIAADDGVMPQTVEAINHAKAANVPIVIAINKVDKPGADPSRIKQELMKYELLPEELGGETLFGEIAARTGQNVDKLLELLHLQAEILELRADPSRPAQGAILESHMDPLRGVVSTVLVQTGTLRTGDVLLSGTQFGRVRMMIDDHGRTLDIAGPSVPVEVVGLTGVPIVGELFIAMPNEKTARRIAAIRAIRKRTRGLRQSRHITLENLQSYISETNTKELKMILKGDVQGSIEAICQSLQKLSTEKVKINILHSGVGSITESDVNLADASDAVIIGFNIRPETSAQSLAQDQGVEIKIYRVIYDLLDEVKLAMKGLLEPKFTEVHRGRAEVKQVFKISHLGNIAGCLVINGEINASDKARLLRDNVIIFEGKIGSLRRMKDEVSSVSQTQECGIALGNFNNVKEGDIIETYIMKEIPQEL
jgi:translation initiation factor IF-2